MLGRALQVLETGAKACFYLTQTMLDGSHGLWRCSLAETAEKMQIPKVVKAESEV